jgi:hypothetical protein
MLENEGVGWLKVSGVSSYILQVSTTSTFSTTVISQGPLIFTHMNLKPSTLYYWQVEAIDPAGSTWSSIWSFTSCDSVHFARHRHDYLNTINYNSQIGISYEYTIILHPTTIYCNDGWGFRGGLLISPEIGLEGAKIALGYFKPMFYNPPFDTAPSFVYIYPSGYSARIAYMHLWSNPSNNPHSQDLFGIEGQLGLSIVALKSGYFFYSTNPRFGAWEFSIGIVCSLPSIVAHSRQ